MMMNGLLTKKGRVAVAAMLELALRSERGPVPLALLSDCQQMSLSYLELLFGRLRRHALVQSTLGPGGGYSPGRACEDISVADIIGAIDDPVVAGRGDSSRAADAVSLPMTQALWDGAHSRLVEYFEAISLQSLVDERRAQDLLKPPAPLRRGISSRPVVKPIHVTRVNSVFALADA